MAIIAFILAGLFVGVLGLLGLLNAVRGTPVRRVVPLGATLPPVDDPSFCTAMELVSRTALSGGHHVETFWNGDQTYPRLWADLRAARTSITLQLYYCETGRMADELREILVDRARAGVRVFFLYDAFGTSFPDEYIDALRAAGVRAEPFRPIGIRTLRTMQHRAHVRVVSIDGTIGWTGGFGISDKWFGDGRTKDHWRDSNVRFTGPAVHQLWAAFAACWTESTGDLLIAPVEPSADGDGPVVAGLLHASPSVGSTEAERFLTYSIASARRTLYITNSYFVPDRAIRTLIADAARRGVDTRILTVSAETDVKSTWYAGRARYEELLAAGVRIFEYQPVMMHAKTLTVDGGWAALGSMNADNRSLSFNEETVLMILDAGVTCTIERQFLDDLGFANEIRLDEFRRRGWIERIKEKACYAVWRVL
ncbi:Phospholipase D-like domain protein [Gemmatirosa kalamazoonensis]|uniref:Phospholipase D-like domain protein n=1 Tax=Gemmatirosa kalamazoonensis TaxID=861299 RepID=W0RMJ6_9BACT|nr:phospholipase D-like domain-containing protein [Gemmatirosa kalamazoonensis]AHG91545.1 Phospholipase D-like domain protein [Gemmatirosa kalamazoonensis]